jgi:hypothetical protein
LEARRRLFGNDDRHTLRTRYDYALILWDLGQAIPARRELQAVLVAQIRLFGEDDRDSLLTDQTLRSIP